MTNRSYTRINYDLRPAKNIERKMIIDVSQRLRAFSPLDRYRYVGFGSTFFSDFRLVHRALGIRNLVSIEANHADRKRILFNRPFRCVKIEIGRAVEILPRLTWRTKSIVWLDYDYPLNEEVLEDVRTVCSKAVGGTMLLVTVNAMPPPAKESEPVASFRDRVGSINMPVGLTGRDLKRWGTAAVCRDVIDATIRYTVSQRSRVLPVNSKLSYQQVFNFNYKDGAKMMTTGGILFRGDQHRDIEAMDLDSIEFVRTETSPYLIEVPNLTMREMHYLDQKLPTRDPDAIKVACVPAKDIERYARVYRHFPTFVDAEL